jgi:hypothetical protein
MLKKKRWGCIGTKPVERELKLLASSKLKASSSSLLSGSIEL